MQLDVSFIPNEAINRDDKCVIVLDILRASSTIIAAFEAGCRSVLPVPDVDEAREIKARNPHMILCGEREGLPPEGFDLGNSPAEYAGQTVKNQELILTTSNGTRAILIGGKNTRVFVGGFLNFTAVLDKALSSGQDILIQCAGNNKAFALEDAFAAAMLVDAVNQRVCNLEIGDNARWTLYALKGMISGREEIGNFEIETVLRNTAHGKHLITVGFSKDISFCAQKDVSATVPYLSSGKLII
ncbi:MAG TPA: 2-phosphosulfolactate phosphatase [Calditrichaeota bacterium]|nr:2-phosphosulfolactate phosphatase [Calditrichota bacterium]